MLRVIACLVGAVTLTGCAGPAASPDPERDKTAIEAALRQWPKDFNDENIGGVCGLFADDAELAHPGGEDRGSGEFCERILFWTLTVTDPAGKVLDTAVEDGLDVFRRQPDGTWKIHVSHAFTK